MTYQLVLQFPQTGSADFETMVGIEHVVSEALSGSSEVDGHDIGSDEFNIFIWTDDPAGAFALIERLPAIQPHLGRLRAAHRPADGETFTPVHPPELVDFVVA